MSDELEVYGRQGFGLGLQIKPPYGLLIVDFVNGFADPGSFGGGNIPAAINKTVDHEYLALEDGNRNGLRSCQSDHGTTLCSVGSSRKPGHFYG